MDRIQVTNPYIRSGPSCRRFKSAVQLSLDRSPLTLPALALIVAEVLTLQAYSPSRSHDYRIDLPSSQIRRSHLNRRKFSISALGHMFNIFCNTVEDADIWAAILSYTSSRRFDRHYRLGRKIDEGRHSQVYMAYQHHGPSTAFIVKVNNRTAECNLSADRSQFERDAHLKLVQNFDVSPRERSMTEKKIDLDERESRESKLKLFLDKIVILRDSFGTPSQDFLVFEHQDGEVLSRFLATNGPLSEREARVVMWDLLTALHYMHEQGVIHRDIRASNVFFWKQEDSLHAKLFDLSEARQVPDGISGEEPFRDSPGKPLHQAYEILTGRYHGKPADIWSCGVLLCHMLTGIVPFRGENEQELSGNIIAQLHQHSLFSAPTWASISPSAISLIKQMLQPDPFKRPSALGARSHQWLSNDLSSRQVVSASPTRGTIQKSSNPTVKATIGMKYDIKCTSSRSPFNLKGFTGFESASLSTSFNTPLRMKCNEKITVSRVTKLRFPFPLLRQEQFLTFPSKTTNSPMVRSPSSFEFRHQNELQATMRDRNETKIHRRSAISSSRSLPSDLKIVWNADSPGANVPSTTANHSAWRLVSLMRRFPDRERSAGKGTSFKSQGLACQCNHFCNSRQCERGMRRSRAGRAWASSRSQADGTTPAQGIDQRGTPSEIMPTGQVSGDDVNSSARVAKFPSDCPLQQAPVDPMFHFKTTTNVVKAACPSEDGNGLQVKSSARPDNPALGMFVAKTPVPLRHEQCVRTFIMHSVRAAAQVGLSEFSRSRPLAAKLLLRSPTAQLQLAIVLPYRRKFRIAGIALKAIFRIISLKKGTCLTRRLLRGQNLPTELWTLLTDIRRKCHMRPLRARMPKLFPPDEFGGMMCKPRFEPPPQIETTPLRFWDRQREVRLGILFRAWEVAKGKIIQMNTALGVGRRNDGEEGDGEESHHNATPGLVSRLSQRIRGFFQRDLEEEEEEEKYHHTVEMV